MLQDQTTSQSDGEKIKEEESKLLGDILSRTSIDFAAYGIDIEQVIGARSDLTYEEVQLVLSEYPITHYLSQNLNEMLQSRLKEEKLYTEAIANDYSISLAYVKILALGPGQVGKSTFLYRLLGIMEGNIETADPETQPLSSTGLVEQREAYIQYTNMTGALTSVNKWQVFGESSEMEVQLGSLMSLISEQIHLCQEKSHRKAAGDESTTKVSESVRNSGRLSEHLSANVNTTKENKPIQDDCFEPADSDSLLQPYLSQYRVPSEIDIDAIIDKLEYLHEECRVNQKHVQLDILLNIADIGGQPAFLEMLPSLTMGPALYLVFMNLVKGLDTRYPVVFKCKDSERQVLCQNYTYTSEEVIFTALSSIVSFGNSDEEVEKYVLKEGPEQQINSLALLVGTFADKVSDQEVTTLHTQIKQKLQETDYYKNKSHFFYTKFLEVNNFSARDNEIKEQRSLIEGLLRDRFRKYRIPVRWLMLSICLKLLAKELHTYEISFSDCLAIGSRFEMTEDTVRAALKFLHKYIGLVMYFPNHPHLKNVVICDPQVVFSSVSELIFDIYNPSKKYVPEAKFDHFVKTGCFSPQDIIGLPTDKQTNTKGKNLLSIETVVELLVHLNIAAEVPLSSVIDCSTTSRSSKNRKEYFLPAVLQTADTVLLKNDILGENDELVPEPLCIHFITGYLPLGFVCALSANLMANNKLLQLVPFKESNQPVTYKNMMRFRYNGEIDVIMISGPKYCEFRVRRWSNLSKTEFWDSNFCPHIKRIIYDATKRVVQSMQHGDPVYKLSNCFELTFKCPEHKDAEVGHEPLATFVYEASNSENTKEPNQIQCISSECITRRPLTPERRIWFGKDVLGTPLKIIRQPVIKDNVIEIKAEGTKPLWYQWFKDGEKLFDDNDYKGSATPELFLRNLKQCLKGMYYCEIQDKSKQCILTSDKIELDPFVIELKREKLMDREISTLIDNEFTSMNDLENLELQDLKLLNLKLGEEKRLRKFLEKLHSKTEASNKGCDPNLSNLKDVFWEVRANWYLLGILLNIDHSDLEVARRKTEVYDKYMSVLQFFIKRTNPQPSWTDVELALKSCVIGHQDLDLPHIVQEQLMRLPCESIYSDHKPNNAIQLRRVLTALWEIRALWRRLAGEVDKISEGDCEAIKANFSSVEDCFAALLQKCLAIYKDSAPRVLLQALRSRAIGRDDIANEFEEKLETGQL